MEKPLAWLKGESRRRRFRAKLEWRSAFCCGDYSAEDVVMPHSRPMPGIAPRCHEPRIRDRDQIWRIIYQPDRDAVVALEVFAKKSNVTPKRIIDVCRKRLKEYDQNRRGGPA